MFGKPGHGAPTEDIRKKRFTEYQLSDGTGRDEGAQNGVESSGMYHYTMDDSCIPSSYETGNPYRAPAPYATEDQNGLSRMKHPSKSEPDIGPIGEVRTFINPVHLLSVVTEIAI